MKLMPGRKRPEGTGSSTESRFMTLEDVATLLNVSVAQVYSLVRSRKLPAMKIGGRGIWRVDRQKLDAFIERTHEETARWTEDHPFTTGEEVEGT